MTLTFAVASPSCEPLGGSVHFGTDSFVERLVYGTPVGDMYQTLPLLIVQGAEIGFDVDSL